MQQQARAPAAASAIAGGPTDDRDAQQEEHMSESQRPPEVGRVVELGVAGRREIVATDAAPRAIGPYSQAVRVGALVFTSGMIGIEPASGALVAGGIGAETACALANLAGVLAAAGSSLGDVVRTTVYLVDMGDFERMNTAYAASFGNAPPARVTIAVTALPRGARVEIEAVALAQP
jgi:2-iminobutanoate/2-iminopropanoate deaminase